MKKSNLVIAALLCAVCLSGCGSKNPNTSRPVTSQSTSTATENQSDISSITEESDSESDVESESKNDEESKNTNSGIYKIGDTITTETWEFTVKSIASTDEISIGYGTYRPDEGDKYVLVELAVKNISKKDEWFMPSVVSSKDLKVVLMYEDYTFKATKLLGYNEDLLQIKINPLSERTGNIVFRIASDVADKTSELKVVFTENDMTYVVKGE